MTIFRLLWIAGLAALVTGAILAGGCGRAASEGEEHGREACADKCAASSRAGESAAANEGCANGAAAAPHASGTVAEVAEKEEHAGLAHASAADPAGRPMCGEHGVPEEECGICRPDLAAALAPGRGLKVRLPAGDSADLVGVTTETPVAGVVGGGTRCFAELAFDQDRLATIVAPVGGVLESVDAGLGARVAKGALLARVWSPEIAETAADALLAHQTLARERKLHADGMTSPMALDAAEAAHRAVCQRARALGLQEAAIDAMALHPDEPVYVEVRAPFAGEIVERSAVQGERVGEGASLFLLADRASMWAMLSVPETEVASVAVGLPVEIAVDALPGRMFPGRITWIAARVDETTRMVLARAEVPNPGGLLRDRMFARARILSDDGTVGLLVPSAAVQRVEGKPFVFVKLADDLYEARAVSLGPEFEGRAAVLAGLGAEDEIVVERSFALKSQLLSSRLGAGCADD